MSPLSNPAITRLDPRYPVLWRDADTVQLGLEGVLTVPTDEHWVEPLLARLSAGIRLSTFDLVAHGVGAPRRAARDLLERVRPLLVTDSPPLPGTWIEGGGVTDQRVLTRLRDALDDEGIPLGQRDDPDSVGIIVIEGAAAAVQLMPYLRDDLVHLPMAFEAGATTIGPLVVPGRTPCVWCRDAAERDRDPAWPLLQAQLVRRAPARIPLLQVAEAAALVPRLLRFARPGVGLSVRLRPGGGQSWRRVIPHAECQCLAQPSQSPPETVTAPAPLAPLNVPTRSRAYARLA